MSIGGIGIMYSINLHTFVEDGYVVDEEGEVIYL